MLGWECMCLRICQGPLIIKAEFRDHATTRRGEILMEFVEYDDC